MGTFRARVRDSMSTLFADSALCSARDTSILYQKYPVWN